MTQNEFSVCKAAEWGDAVASSIDDNAVEWNSGKSLCEIWMIQHTSIQYGTKKPRKYAVCNRGWENRTPTKSFGDSYHTIWPIPYIVWRKHLVFTKCFIFYVPSKPHTRNHPLFFLKPSWLCPRPISNSQLHTLLHFHLCPIYLVVFKGSYNLRWDISSWGGLHA